MEGIRHLIETIRSGDSYAVALARRRLGEATDIAHQPILVEKLLLRIESGAPPDEAFGRVIASKARQIGDGVNPKESLRHDYHRALRESRERARSTALSPFTSQEDRILRCASREAVADGIISSPSGS